VPKFTIVNPPAPHRIYFWMSTTRDSKRGLKPGLAVETDPGDPLPDGAEYWCYPSDKCWTRIQFDDTSVPPAPSFVPDEPSLPAPPNHVLVVTKNLNFAWVPLSTPLPLTLPHATEPGAAFYACDWTFVSWMLARLDKAKRIGHTLTDSERRGVARAWAHVIEVYGVHSDDDERIPKPGAVLPPLLTGG
jgi:hypothetical protein